jgi:cytosine/adenosine deaminase-related metal-dependent hydrolase
MLLRARTVLPVCAPPIDDGAVLVRGGHIEAVGKFSELSGADPGDVVDLGHAILLPGLINAHCHLDYTGMAGQLRPARHFSDWIKAIVALKSGWSYTDYAESWLKGAKMLLRTGTTTVVDIEAVPELLPEVVTATPLRVVSCLELLSVRSRQTARQMVQAAVEKLGTLPGEPPGLSPHAPYSTSPELLRAAAVAARERGWLLTTHVAESEDEFEMFQVGRGSMFDWLKPQRDLSDCGQGTPVAYLARHGVLSPHFLAVHANYLAPGDAALLALAGASVVHCPGSHAFFGHQKFPLNELIKTGVNLCLGTDSLATMPVKRNETAELNLFSEMRRLAENYPALKPQRILAMTTMNAAHAIGRPTELGRLAPGSCADLIAVPRGKTRDPYQAVLNHRGDVLASMVRGRWVQASS